MSDATPHSGLFRPLEDSVREDRPDRDSEAVSPLQPALESPDAAPTAIEPSDPHVPAPPDMDRLASTRRTDSKSARDVPVIIASARGDAKPDDESSSGQMNTPGGTSWNASEPAKPGAEPADPEEPKLTWAERARRGLLTGPSSEPAGAAPARTRQVGVADSAPSSSAESSTAPRSSAGVVRAGGQTASAPPHQREAAVTASSESQTSRSVGAATAATAPPSGSPAFASREESAAGDSRMGRTADSDSLAALAGSLQRIERTLGEIRAVMDAGAREERYKEFSLPRLIAPVAQLIALALVLFALLDWVFGREVGWLLAKLGFACVVQLVALTAVLASVDGRRR